MKKIDFKLVVIFSFLILFTGSHYSFSQEKELPIAEHYEGGTDSLRSDIEKIKIYPANAKRNRIQGETIVFITMEEDGSFSTVRLVKKIGGGCDAEAIRIVKELEKNGKFAKPGYKANYQIPIYFKL